MFSAGLFGFITAMAIHMIPTVLSTRGAGIEVRQLYPLRFAPVLGRFRDCS